MPHVDELLGVTTLASMGLLVAVSLQPVEGAKGASVASAEAPIAATRVIVTGTGVAGQPLSSAMPAATAKEPT
ncbi:MAG TPA: hypothetical protein VJV77_11205 [Casimicrobiaceae bacterium]|nr:hypothetical protein [Casimicrobiaceae bacterium]